jgi:FkbM family methyltransferase
MGLKRLWKKINRRLNPVRQGVTPLPRQALVGADAIVTTNEVSDRHGTGVILNRVFGQASNILSVRSTNLYGEHRLGAARLCLNHEGLSRAQSFARMLYALNGATVRRVLSVPFLPDELISAIVLKELFGAPLCTFIMDDNNLHSRGIPEELMREALNKSALRLAISPEMRDAYEDKYGLKFWVMPPVVRSEVVRTEPVEFQPNGERLGPGALVGSIWSQRWLEQLRRTVRCAGLQVHWYGNARAPWLKTTPGQLRRDGIIDCGFLPEQQLTERLKDYAYALVPSGTLDENDDRPEIARLSLPTRLPYLLAATHTPMVLLGSRLSAAARFLERFQVGRVAPYDPERLRQVVADVCQPAAQRHFRGQAARHSALFSAAGLEQWIWQSLEGGEPVDERFEHVFARRKSDILAYLDPPAPPDLQGDHVRVYQALRRLKRQGLAPDFVVDVGASTGIWSDIAHRVFPKARFILIEPLQAQHASRCPWILARHPEFECVPVAVAEQPGRATLNVSSDFYGSSLLHPCDHRSYEPVEVQVSTLDRVAREKQLSGRGLLKIDVQFTEHLVLAGAADLLPQVDALIVELSLVRCASQPLMFPEMCDRIYELGFRYYEDLGGWRDPQTGTLLQKDALFIREDLFTQPASPRLSSKVEMLPPEPELELERT